MPASLSSAKLPLTISRFAALGELQQQNRGGPTDMKPPIKTENDAVRRSGSGNLETQNEPDFSVRLQMQTR